MKFKTKRIEREFDLIYPQLRALLFELDRFSSKYLHRDILITHLLRTQEEQNRFYSNRIDEGFYVIIDGKKFYSRDKKTPTYSVHQFGRGADIRSKWYQPYEKDILCKFINEYFPYPGKYSSCVFHNIGLGEHFHIQVPSVGKAPIDYLTYRPGGNKYGTIFENQQET